MKRWPIATALAPERQRPELVIARLPERRGCRSRTIIVISVSMDTFEEHA